MNNKKDNMIRKSKLKLNCYAKLIVLENHFKRNLSIKLYGRSKFYGKNAISMIDFLEVKNKSSYVPNFKAPVTPHRIMLTDVQRTPKSSIRSHPFLVRIQSGEVQSTL